MSDPVTLWTAVGGGSGLLGLIGYCIRSNAALKGEFDDFRVKVAENYTSREALKELKDDMDKRFDKLERMLNGGRES
jgi:hypothetical protein